MTMMDIICIIGVGYLTWGIIGGPAVSVSRVRGHRVCTAELQGGDCAATGRALYVSRRGAGSKLGPVK